jgi:hypothetical protein
MHLNKTPAIEPTLIAAAGAGATALNTDLDILDGATSVWAYIQLGGTVTVNGGTPGVKVFQASISDYSDAVEVTDLRTLFVDTTHANKGFVVELVKPTKRYIRIQIDRVGGTNSIIVSGGLAVVHRDRKQPVAVTSTVVSRKVKLGS